MNYSLFHSLRFRFLIGSIVLLLLLFGLLAYHTHKTLYTFALANTRAIIKQTSETLNLAVVPHTANEELVILEAYLNGLITGEEFGIIYMALVDERGHILVSTRSMPDTLPPEGTDLEQQLQTGIVHVSQPILLSDNRIGQLRYGMSTRMLKETHEVFIQEYLALLVGGLIVVIVILMVIGLRVGAQLGQLLQASKELTAGNYEARTYVSGRNELAHLGHSFNQMADAVAERTDALQERERELAHVARLGTMGEMATGIAHELNQPLTALVSYCGTAASLVNSLSSPPKQISEILELAKEQALRAGDIIRNLREFVSKESNDKETFEINRVIYDIVTFLKSEVQKSGVKIELQLDGRARKIIANRVQIEQVLVNLVRNSLEAFEHTISAGGRIGIQTRLLSNDMIEVVVTDNGPGIDAALADKIFDQFQSSKPTGMGIGLSLSRSIIEAHGGKLWVDKEHKNGALFAFELPVSE